MGRIGKSRVIEEVKVRVRSMEEVDEVVERVPDGLRTVIFDCGKDMKLAEKVASLGKVLANGVLVGLRCIDVKDVSMLRNVHTLYLDGCTGITDVNMLNNVV